VYGAGHSQRSGIVYVDHTPRRCIPKATARWYADMIAARRGFSTAKPLNRAES